LKVSGASRLGLDLETGFTQRVLKPVPTLNLTTTKWVVLVARSVAITPLLLTLFALLAMPRRKEPGAAFEVVTNTRARWLMNPVPPVSSLNEAKKLLKADDGNWLKFTLKLAYRMYPNVVPNEGPEGPTLV